MAVAHKSAISYGFLYVPVGLYKTTRDTSISFNQLCKDSHERVKYKKICPSCNKEVKNDDIIKGYEYEKGRYVIFTPEELENLKSEKDRTISIDHFTKISEIDPIYFERNYYLVPEPGAEKSYEILRRVMLATKLTAIARVVISTKEELIALFPTKDCIIAKLLFYQEEIQEIPKSNIKVDISKEEMEMAKIMVESSVKKFDVSAYYDKYQQKIREAIVAKINGNQIIAAKQEVVNHIIDSMEALQKTIELIKNNKIGQPK